MGAWFFVDTFIEWVLNQIQAKHRRPRYAGRPAAASTAVGQMTTLAPPEASLCADAAPSPVPPPVTMATLPANSLIVTAC